LKPILPACAAQTRHYEETGDGRLVYTGAPTAKALLGKMRWLARLAVLLATAQGNLHLNHDEAEGKLYRVKIRGSSGARELGLVPFAFGTTVGAPWKGVVSVSLSVPGAHRVYSSRGEIVDRHAEALKSAGTRYALLTARDTAEKKASSR